MTAPEPTVAQRAREAATDRSVQEDKFPAFEYGYVVAWDARGTAFESLRKEIEIALSDDDRVSEEDLRTDLLPRTHDALLAALDAPTTKEKGTTE